MKTSWRFLLPLLSLLPALLLSGCGRGRGRVQEIAYVSAPQAILRDRVSAVFSKTGTVKNGDRVQVLERERHFVRVRTASGAEGWIEQRSLVPESVYDGFQKLSQQAQSDPIQAIGTTRNDTNIHLEPGRETEHLYQLNQGSKVSILRRATAEKTVPGGMAKPASSKNESAKPVTPLMEDWWLIRDPDSRVGWVLARFVDLDVPLEIAEYAEGQRIVAFFVLNQVADGDKKVPQYLVVLTEPKDGLPFDYNQIRVFTWNVRKHRYETAYREHNLNGFLPVTVSQENFDKEGALPVFVLRVKDDDGNVSERKYKMNTPIVRRVLAPGEAKEVSTPRKKTRHH
ncbi:MAG TPA: SH3 domain-containing protein [Terriglobales bacterium]|nr:SH3 domain-containing protein [Terriglobales bacterium]